MDSCLKVALCLILTLAVALRIQAHLDCLSTGCEPGAICTDYGNGYYRCSSAAGSFATSCHVDGCVDGSCVDQADGTSKCICIPGNAVDPADGKTCLPINCPTKPCTDGTCRIKSTGTKVCVCKEGYVHSSTDQAVCVPKSATSTTDSCALKSCQFGVCTKVNGVDKCQCIQGYKLSDTDPWVCVLSDNCPNKPCTDGVCQTTATGSKFCVCKVGFVRSQYDSTVCQQRYQGSYNPCATIYCTNGYCQYNHYGPMCMCFPGYELSRTRAYTCDKKYTPPPNPCATYYCENGRCSIGFNGQPYCTCNDGFEIDSSFPQRCIRKTPPPPPPPPKSKAPTFFDFWKYQMLLDEM